MSAARQNNADLKKRILVNVPDAKATDNDGTTLPWWALQGVETQSWWNFYLPSLMPKPSTMNEKLPWWALQGLETQSLPPKLDAEASDNERITVLMSAPRCGNAKLVELLPPKSDAEARNDYEQTPWHYVYSQNTIISFDKNLTNYDSSL